MGNDGKMLTTREAAEFLAVKPQTLAVWRMTGKHLSFIHVGRAVRYRRSALEAFLDGQTVAAS